MERTAYSILRQPLSSPQALSAGVRLIGFPGQPAEDSLPIEISSGIIPALVQYPTLPYLARAFVPRLPWKNPTDIEQSYLLGPKDESKPGEWVQIVRVPADILKGFEAISCARIADKSELPRYVNTDECQRAISYALEYIGAFSSARKYPLEGVGIFGNPPGLPTTTLADASHLNGLHVDNFYGMTPSGRGRSPNRFAINIGKSDRYFLYVNLPFSDMARLVRERRIEYSTQDKSTLALRSAFMAAFPEYPVVKLRVRPGEAYIAPTENLIHDGCSVGQHGFDIRFSVRGDFNPGDC